jgi:hypothetical protein
LLWLADISKKELVVVLIKKELLPLIGYLHCCFSCPYNDICYVLGSITTASVPCCLHGLAPFSTAIQLHASCEPKLLSALVICFYLFTCFVIVLLLSDANAGDANVPITRAAAAKTATNARVEF